MGKYRKALPQLSKKIFLTDSGLETHLIYDKSINLQDFAAFELLRSSRGFYELYEYFASHAELARRYGMGFILESPTWRANPDWGEKLGYSRKDLDHFNEQAIHLLEQVRGEYEGYDSPMVISGCLGPREDGYAANNYMSESEAANYHSQQIESFSHTNVDCITALTLTYPEEAIGIADAAREYSMPAVISFTVETDGRLPSGYSLKQAIDEVDAATDNYPAYYMINCAHPSHFREALESHEVWAHRIKGLRANASEKSHQELDCLHCLDRGDPQALGKAYQGILGEYKDMNILGGCCGTDLEHIEAICRHCVSRFGKKKAA